MSDKPVIALTPGEPAGIGPDLCILLAQQSFEATLVLIADSEVLEARAEKLKVPFNWRPWTGRPKEDIAVAVLNVKAASPVQAGHLHPANAGYVVQALERAITGCIQGEFDALVTGPVHKGIINDAGIPFTGHTEFLAQQSGTPLPVMMLANPTLRVALATTHLPLSEVSRQITRKRLIGVLEILDAGLKEHFGISSPRIAVLGLNPHAGESGYLGREEINVIAPVIESLNSQGMSLRGPLPADTAFIPSELDKADAWLAMYHDQGLPVVKQSDFTHTVNLTLGLPFIRTSVDHGTALELAGSGRADPASLSAAVIMALRFALRSRQASARRKQNA